MAAGAAGTGGMFAVAVRDVSDACAVATAGVGGGVSEEPVAARTAKTSTAAAAAAPTPMKSPLFDFFSDAGSSRLSSAFMRDRATGATIRLGASAAAAICAANGDGTGAGGRAEGGAAWGVLRTAP